MADDMPDLDWLAVKNRDTMIEAEEHNSTAASMHTEATWFKCNLSKVSSEKVGIVAVTSKCDSLFSRHISRTRTCNNIACNVFVYATCFLLPIISLVGSCAHTH